MKNRICAFLGTVTAEYNLSSILEQVTAGTRVPENGEPADGFRVLENGNP